MTESRKENRPPMTRTVSSVGSRTSSRMIGTVFRPAATRTATSPGL